MSLFFYLSDVQIFSTIFVVDIHSFFLFIFNLPSQNLLQEKSFFVIFVTI